MKKLIFILSAVIICCYSANLYSQVVFSTNDASTTLTSANANPNVADIVDMLTEFGMTFFASINDNITAVDDEVFANVGILTGVIGNNVKTLGNKVFYGCTALTSAQLFNLETIGNSAFKGCTALGAVFFYTVESIGDSAFAGCSALSFVAMGTHFTTPTAITFGNNVFSGVATGNIDLIISANVLPAPSGNTWNGYTWRSITMYDVNSPLVVTFSTTDASSALTNANITPNPSVFLFPFKATFADNITSIKHAFWGNNFIVEAFSNNVTVLDSSAFMNCTSLVAVNFPNVTIIREGVFRNTSLSSAYFPNLVTVGEGGQWTASGPFSRCSLLTTVNFPKVTTVGDMVFFSSPNITSVSLGTAFQTETTITFGYVSFDIPATGNIDLTLSKNVLPKPNVTANTWQDWGSTGAQSYVWKSITVVDGTVELKDYTLTFRIYHDDVFQYDSIIECKENDVRSFNFKDKECYKFVNVTDVEGNIKCNANTPIMSVTVVSDTILNINYSSIQYELFVSTSAGGTTNLVDGSTILNCGEGFLLTATPDECYTFTHWSDTEGNEISTDNPFTIAIYKNTTIRANFEIKEFELTLAASPTVGGTVVGMLHTTPLPNGSTVDCGETVEIIATAKEGYQFLRWTDGNNIWFSSNATATVTMDANKHFIAHFQILPEDGEFIVELNSNISGVSFIGDGIHDSNTVVTISATTTDNCYEFKHWINSAGNFVSAENPFEITVVSDTVLTAIFEIKEFDLTLKIYFDGVETASSTMGTPCGGLHILNANPIDDYEFVNWTDENGNEISSENPYDFFIFSDTVVIANYKTSSITENTLISSIRILPNPVHNDAIIEINSIASQPNTVITILDLSGREILTVYSGLLLEGVNTFALPNGLASGSYFVLVQNGNGRKAERFVVAR